MYNNILYMLIWFPLGLFIICVHVTLKCVSEKIRMFQAYSPCTFHIILHVHLCWIGGYRDKYWRSLYYFFSLVRLILKNTKRNRKKKTEKNCSVCAGIDHIEFNTFKNNSKQSTRSQLANIGSNSNIRLLQHSEEFINTLCGCATTPTLNI